MHITLTPRTDTPAVATADALRAARTLRAEGWPAECVGLAWGSLSTLVLLGDEAELPEWAEIFAARFRTWLRVEVVR